MLFISSTVIHMKATQHFHRGLLLGTTRIKGKEIKITDSIYRMSLGLKNGLAGYGLNLMNI